jgi:hypothetical protein
MTVLSALLLTVWCGASWYVCGVAGRASVSLRTLLGLTLTMAIGMLLATLGLLAAAGCWIALLAAVAGTAAYARRTARPVPSSTGTSWPYAAIVAAVAFIAWPAIVRPPTDGDTLIYHLPNAASWMHAHSLWVTDTHYWWYPGASEMMAAVLATACGPFALPATGTLALFALAAAAYEGAFAACGHRTFALACALALATSNVAAVQGGDLQNDVLLAALLLGLTTAGLAGARAVWPIALALALTKPYGWIYAAVSAVAAGRRTRAVLALVLVTIGIWCARDAALARGAIDPLFGSGSSRELWTTSILSHGAGGIALLVTSALRDGRTTTAFFVCAFASVFWLTKSAYTRVAFASALAFLATPYSYDGGGTAQLAVGYSLRYALPALACGCVALAQAAALAERRRPGILPVAAAYFLGESAWNLVRYRQIYEPDQSTAFMPWVLVIAGATGLALHFAPAWAPARTANAQRFVAFSALAALLVLGARTRAVSDPVAYYAGALGEQGTFVSLPALLRRDPATAIAAAGFPAGIAAVVRPDARVLDVPFGVTPCAFARSARVPVYVHGAASASTDDADGCAVTSPNAVDVRVTAARAP